jgi:hypothetical protein
VKYRLAEVVWDALAVICDWTAAHRVTNWPNGWFHRVACHEFTMFCNRRRLWRP